MDRYGRNREEIEDIEDRRILKFFLIVRYGGYRRYRGYRTKKKLVVLKNKIVLI